MSFIVVMAELIPKEGAEEKLIPLAEQMELSLSLKSGKA